MRALRCVSAAAAVLILAGPATAAGKGAAGRPARLRQALAAPGAVRSVFFVRGMSCRACTMLLDRHLNDAVEGIFWARFNYPLRLLTVYHDPALVTTAALERDVSGSGELRAALMKTGAAGSPAAGRGGAVASWSGGTLTAAEAAEAVLPFRKTLGAYMIEPGTEEWHQVAYEIAGEEVRNRIIRARAREGGYGPAAVSVDIPAVVAKDFYWPVEKLPPTPEESAVARFLREKVILHDEGPEGRHRFDDWLLGLWKEEALEFRGEALELE